MASTTTQYAQGQDVTGRQVQRGAGHPRDPKKRLQDLSNTRKSNHRPATQDVGGSFRVNNISGNGMIYFRYVFSEL